MRIIIFSLSIVLFFVSCRPRPASIEGVPFKATTEEKWGLLGNDGKVLTVNSFEQQPSAIVGGMFSVADSQGLYRLYNIKTPLSPVTSRTFTQIGSFREAVTLAQEEKGSPLLLVGKQGESVKRLMSWEGQPIIMAHNFSEGLALICTGNNKYGYIDTQGEVVIPPLYECAYDFSDGLALVGIAGPGDRIAYQVIDRKGKTVFYIGLQNCRLQGKFSERLLPFRHLQKNFCGYLGSEGKTVLELPGEIQEITGFRYGGALFLTEQGIGLIDKTGRIRIPARYEQGFIAGPERIALRQQHKWGLCDFEGQPLCDFVYDSLSAFNEEGYAFAYKDNRWSMIGREGQPVDQDTFARLIPDRLSDPDYPEVFTLYVPEESPETQDEQPASTPSSLQPDALLPSKVTDNPFYSEAQKVLSGELPELDARNRRIILDYMERFRDSYNIKDLDFLEQVFSEDALIVVGKVVRKAGNEKLRYLSSDQVVYNLKSKREYLNRLKTVFESNREIRVHFSRFRLRKHPTIEGIYGVSVKQNYTSDIYSDEGYLFLLWDFRDETAPLIHVRTWQPGMVDEHTPLPEQEIFSIRNFNIE